MFGHQKPIKPYGFIGFSRRQIHFIDTVQQKWSFVRKKYQTQHVFIGFGNSKLHFAILYCSEASSLTYPLRKGLITDWSLSEVFPLQILYEKA